MTVLHSFDPSMHTAPLGSWGILGRRSWAPGGSARRTNRPPQRPYQRRGPTGLDAPKRAPWAFWGATGPLRRTPPLALGSFASSDTRVAGSVFPAPIREDPFHVMPLRGPDSPHVGLLATGGPNSTGPAQHHLGASFPRPVHSLRRIVMHRPRSMVRGRFRGPAGDQRREDPLRSGGAPPGAARTTRKPAALAPVRPAPGRPGHSWAVPRRAPVAR